MSNDAIPVFLYASEKSPEALAEDLREVLSELPAKRVETFEEIGQDEALLVASGILNPSPEHFDFLIEGLEEFDFVLQPSLSGKVLALAIDASSVEVRAVAKVVVENPQVPFLDIMKAAQQAGVDACVQPPWYGTIDGTLGTDFAYQHMQALALNQESEPLAIRTLEWLRKEAQNG